MVDCTEGESRDWDWGRVSLGYNEVVGKERGLPLVGSSLHGRLLVEALDKSSLEMGGFGLRLCEVDPESKNVPGAIVVRGKRPCGCEEVSYALQ